MAERPEIVSLEVAKTSVGPGHDPAAVERAWAAATAYVWNRIVPWYEPDSEGNPPAPVPPAPGDLVQAVLLLTARYLARRNSPDGFLGMSEFGVARVPTVDRDVEALIGPYRPVVFG